MSDRRTITLGTLAALALAGSALGQAKPLTYDDDALPVLKQHCVSCHNAEKARGGLNVASYGKVLEGGSSGVVVKPGDPDGSRLWTLSAHKDQPKMPPNAPMIAQASVDKLRLWIEQGARENSGSKVNIAAMKPKTEIGLTSIVKGRPPGPPPMPNGKLRLDPIVKSRRPNAITALAASPWAPLVAVGGQKQVLLYQSDTQELLGVLPFEPGLPQVLKFSRNGKLLLAGGGRGGASGKVVVWNVETGEKIIEVGNETDAVLAADISADQTLIALGGPSKILRFYSTKDGTLVREVKKHTDWIYAIDFSPDGVLVASADRSGGLHVWESFTGRPFFEMRGHTAAVLDVSWRMDANVLASGSEDGTIRLWEMENGNQIKTWAGHGGGVQSVRFHTDGRLVSAGRDRIVKTWDGNGAQQKAFPPLTDVAMRSALTHDGLRAVGGDWSGVLHVWTVADTKLVGTLDSNPAPLGERIAAAQKELAESQAAAEVAAKAFAAAQVAATNAQNELVASQKAVTEKTAAAQVATAAVAPAKTAVDQVTAALAAAQLLVTARDVSAKAYAEAAAKIKVAADATPANKELAAAAQKGKELAGSAAIELASAVKAVNDSTVALKAASDRQVVTQKTAADAATAATEAPKVVTQKQALVKQTGDALNAAKANADVTAARFATAKARHDKLKSSQVVAAK